MNKISKQIFGFLILSVVISPLAFFSPGIANAKKGGLIDDTRAAQIKKAQAKNTGGTTAKEAGDSIVIQFSETTNKYEINAANIDQEISLGSGHSFLDGNDQLGDALWSDNGKKLYIFLSDDGGAPSVSLGDKVSISGDGIKDLSGKSIRGSVALRGSFSKIHDDGCRVVSTSAQMITIAKNGSDDSSDDDSSDDSSDDSDDNDEIDDSGNDSPSDLDDSDEDSDDDDDCDRSVEERGKFRCGNGLQNGKLYIINGSPTVYLLTACQLKPFRGIAAFNSRGLKFDDVTLLPALPANATISDEPVVPAEGTLVKGSDATVWFVDNNGKRRGFVSSDVFFKLGFSFNHVDQISDSDLGEIDVDQNVDDGLDHPDGSLIQCANSGVVYKVIKGVKFAFANSESFRSHGHRFEHILSVNCAQFNYEDGAAITE
ncbi:MAG: hypothetical protein R3B41_03265 [Candidatus Doudnabacteria bacterium]